MTPPDAADVAVYTPPELPKNMIPLGAVKAFDPNDGKADEAGYIPHQSDGAFTTPVISAQQYADVFMKAVDSPSSIEFMKAALAKAINAAPSLQSFGKMSLMPESYANGIINWPGIPPEMLKKIAEDHLAPKVIIQQRIADVLRYASPATHPWKPGWKIEMREGFATATDEDMAEIKKMEAFIMNCCEGTRDVRQRDALGLKSFRNFLSSAVRDRLRYDLVSVWTDMDTQDKVRAFKVMPADRIRLTTADGYGGDKNIFAVGLDDGGRVQRGFTRKELFCSVYNDRSDVDAMGYGYPEIEMAMRIIQAFTDAFDMNADVFNKNSVPNGILMATGWNNKQIEVLNSIWSNLKKGTSKTWALPVMGLPKEGKLEILDLSRMKENDVYYENFINMLGGLYSTIFTFPPDRLGYRISGKGHDNKPEKDTTSGTIVDTADPGLAPLLDFLEGLINEYIVYSRNPKLQFRFQGKNPKEDARAYEAKMEAATYGERRALSDLPPLETLVKDKQHKELAALMAACPSDPNLAPVWTAMVQVVVAAKYAPEEAAPPGGKPPGARMNGKKDPAASEAHGHTSGVRRNSKAETSKSLSTLYISRYVDNPEDILEWAAAEGIPNLLDPDDLHVTIAFSREAVDWDSVGIAPAELDIPASVSRRVEPLGDKGAVVLKFASSQLQTRWHKVMSAGASWDFDGFHPHVTLSYRAEGVNLDRVRPYTGPILLGREVFTPVDENWALGKTTTYSSVGDAEADMVLSIKENADNNNPIFDKSIQLSSLGDGLGIEDTIPKSDEDDEDAKQGVGVNFGTTYQQSA